MGNVKRPILLFVNAILNAQIAKGGDGIGRIMVIEFQGEDSKAFDKVMMVLKGFSVLEKINLYNETVIDLPGLKICPNRRIIYNGSQEISMTKKSLTSSICWRSIKGGCWLMDRFTKVSGTGMQPVVRELLLCTTYGIYQKSLVIFLPFPYSV